MIPQSGIGEEKSKLAQARLQEVCFFADPFARRLHPSPSLSVPIRVIRGYFPLQPRSTLLLLNCEQFTLCGLGVRGGQILWVIGSCRQPLQGAWGKRCAGCIKGDMAEARFAVTRCGMNSDSVGGSGMALEEEVEAFERACGAGFDFNRNDA